MSNTYRDNLELSNKLTYVSELWKKGRKQYKLVSENGYYCVV